MVNAVDRYFFHKKNLIIDIWQGSQYVYENRKSICVIYSTAALNIKEKDYESDSGTFAIILNKFI